MPFTPRTRSVKPRLAGKGIPGGDIGTEHVYKAGIATADVASTDDAHPFPGNRAVGEAQIIAKLSTQCAWSLVAVGAYSDARLRGW